MNAMGFKNDDRDEDALDRESPDGEASDGEIGDELPFGEEDPALEALDGELPGKEGEEAPQQDAELLKNQLLRLTADFDNFRKRTQRDKQDWSRYAAQGIMEKLIPVADNLDAAAVAVEGASQEGKNVAEGFLMIHKQLMEILAQEGLAEIEALVEVFDPNVHEAVMAVERQEGQQENQVVMVLRKGYMYKDKVIRPSMVQVAKS